MPNIVHRTAAIVSIGDELVLGQTLDTNSRWLSQQLFDHGVTVIQHTTIPDDTQAHAAALTRLAPLVDLIISSGGLGPTKDDLTREALAQFMHDPLIEDPDALQHLHAWYTHRGRALNDLNRLQALRPSTAHCLPNPHGTAPGLSARLGNCDIFCLPGPPREMMPMFSACVVPRLRPPTDRTVRTRALHAFGIAESDLAARLGALMDRDALTRGGVLVGTTASGGVVSVRLRYEGPDAAAEADRQLDAVALDVRARAGDYIFGEGTDTLAGVVVAALIARRHTLGCVESCTGGLLSEKITAIPGSSQAFIGGLITYSNAVKQQLAHVPATLFADAGPGAVSEETARAMALGGLDVLRTDVCLAITGIAGPGGSTLIKPVGLVHIALASRGVAAPRVETRRFQFVGERDNVRTWSAMSALMMLWHHLAGQRDVTLLRQC
jgi:nicotinamide-nucleotide amidase